MGGGTTINGCQFYKPCREDLDNWASLGNAGWDYDSFLPYFMKSENFEGEEYPGYGKICHYVAIKITYIHILFSLQTKMIRVYDYFLNCFLLDIFMSPFRRYLSSILINAISNILSMMVY